MNGRRFALVSLAAFATMAALRVCDPLLPPIAREFGVHSGQAGQTVSAFAIAYGLALLLYGPVADRRDKFGVIAYATLACTVGCVACAMSPSLRLLVLFRIGWGIAAAGVTPVAMAWIGDTVPYARRQEVLSKLIGGTTLGLIAGQSLGAILADTLGWRSAFWALGALFAAVGVLMCVEIWRDPSQLGGTTRNATRTSPLRDYGHVMSTPWARRVLLFAFLEGAFVFGVLAFLPSHLHQHFGLPLAWAGGVLALYGAGGVIFSRIAGPLLRRFGPSGLARAGSAAMCVYCAAIAILPAWWWALPACFAGGLGFYMLHSTLQAHATQMVPAVRGTAVTLFSSSLFMGNSLGVAIAAIAVDRWSFAPVAFASAIALPAIGWRFAAQADAHHRVLQPKGLPTTSP